MPPLPAVVDAPAPFVLALQLALIAAAAFAGGSSVAFLSLSHRQTQVLLSLTGGVLLGVGLLHLLPHAWLQLDRDLETTMGWVLLGFFAQAFFTMRFLVQWIASERAGKSVIPIAFWWCSIGGGLLLLAYALYRDRKSTRLNSSHRT